MTDKRNERKKDRRAKYISYMLVFMTMVGFRYMTEGRKPTEPGMDKSIIGSIYKIPRTTHIISDIYDVSICGKYYRADAVCNEILHSFVQFSETRKKTII